MGGDLRNTAKEADPLSLHLDSSSGAQTVTDGAGRTAEFMEATGVINTDDGTNTASLSDGTFGVNTSSLQVSADAAYFTGLTQGELTKIDSNNKLSSASAGTDYVASESDPIVGAIDGIVKADGAGNISAASAGTDYVEEEEDPIVGAITGIIQADGAGGITSATLPVTLGTSNPNNFALKVTTDETTGVTVSGYQFGVGYGQQIFLSNNLTGTQTFNLPDLGGTATVTLAKQGYVTIENAESNSSISPVADGTYTVGIGGTTNGTITVSKGIITAIQEAVA